MLYSINFHLFAKQETKTPNKASKNEGSKRHQLYRYRELLLGNKRPSA